jgi:excisionase family DNA binding protein
MKTIFSPKEVARILKVAPTTIYAELHSGNLKHSRVGRRFLITKSDLESYVGSAARLYEMLSDLNVESQTWLKAELTADIPPYDWGDSGIPEGKPVFYDPEIGFFVLESES